jgi:hypothetical protein
MSSASGARGRKQVATIGTRCIGYCCEYIAGGPTLERQKALLRRAGCKAKDVWIEGRRNAAPKELYKAMVDVRRGETLVVATLRCIKSAKRWAARALAPSCAYAGRRTCRVVTSTWRKD